MFCGPGQALCRCPCSVKAPWTVISSFPSTERRAMFTAKMGMANHFVQQVLTRAA